MAVIKNLLDESGQVLYPVTKSNVVYFTDNQTLDDKIKNLNESMLTEVPIATATQLGGIKSSDSIAIDNTGVASINDSYIDNKTSTAISNITGSTIVTKLKTIDGYGRKIFISTTEPTSDIGEDGDIFLVYEG